MRKFFISGNWKMQLDRAESLELAALTMATLPDNCPAEVVLMPTFVHLDAVGQLIRSSPLLLGAQNVYFEKKGAFTGEISPAMLDDIGVKYVLVGHSERRHIIGETDEILNKKAIAVITEGLAAVLCVGETLDQRQSYRTVEIVGRQLDAGLAHISTEAADKGLLVIAYEPVWAIGTGHTATPAQAQEVHKYIRGKLTERFGDAVASRIRIQYGGSVKKNNAAELLAQPDIDGLLVGGASLIADEFLGIILAAAQCRHIEGIFMTYFLAIVFVLMSLLLMFVVLIQRGRGGGLVGAFGGGGGGSAFGSKTGDVFTTVTVILFIIFLLLAVWLNLRMQPAGPTPAAAAPTPPASRAPAPVTSKP